MDKTLEIVLVATTLVVAAVVVISMLQGQSDSFGVFADDQTESASCGLGYQQWQNSIQCDGSGNGEETSRSEELRTDSYSDCDWTSGYDEDDACSG